MSNCHECTYFQGIDGGAINCDVAPWRPSADLATSAQCGAFLPASAYQAPKPSPPLPNAASEAADHLMSAARAIRYVRNGEDFADRLHEVEARLRSAIAAEEERAKIRRAAAEAIMAHIAHEADAKSPHRPYSEEVIRWAKMETSR